MMHRVNNNQSTMENPHEAEQTRLLERIIKNVVSKAVGLCE